MDLKELNITRNYKFANHFMCSTLTKSANQLFGMITSFLQPGHSFRALNKKGLKLIS